MRYRFRPKYRVIPWISAGLGVAILGIGLFVDLDRESRIFALASGIFGPALAAMYLASSAWKLAIETGEDGLKLWAGSELRFTIAWSEVVKLIHSPTHKTAFVDGGVPDKSLVLPGPGVPAPYRIEKQAALYGELLGRIPKDRQEIRE